MNLSGSLPAVIILGEEDKRLSVVFRNNLTRDKIFYVKTRVGKIAF